MKTKLEIAREWLPRYTGTDLNTFGDYILLTNFSEYVNRFSELFNVEVEGVGKPMQTATNKDNLSIINFGIGAANAATIIDLLIARQPKGILFLGKCGGIKKASELGNFVLPIAAIRASGVDEHEHWLPKEVPALPAFKLHKFVSDKIVKYGLDYRTGVIYTTSRRLWEWDEEFKKYLRRIGAIAIDMETATVFTVGYANAIPCGALLLVSDTPMLEGGIKTEASDQYVSETYVHHHLQIGIESMTEIGTKGEAIKHFHF